MQAANEIPSSLVALALVATLTACGGEGDATQPTTMPAGETEVANLVFPEAGVEAEVEVEVEVVDGAIAVAVGAAGGGAAIGGSARTTAMTSTSFASDTRVPAKRAEPKLQSAMATGSSPRPVLDSEGELEVEAEVEVEATNGAAAAGAGASAAGAGSSLRAFVDEADGTPFSVSTAMVTQTATDAITARVLIPYVPMNEALGKPQPLVRPGAPDHHQELEGDQPDGLDGEVEVGAEVEAEVEAEMGAASAGVAGAVGGVAAGTDPFTHGHVSTAVSASAWEVTEEGPVGTEEPVAFSGSPDPGYLTAESESEVEVEVEVEAENNGAAAAAVAGGIGGQSGLGSTAFASASTATSTSTEGHSGELVRNNDVRAAETSSKGSTDWATYEPPPKLEVEAEVEAEAGMRKDGTPRATITTEVVATGDVTATAQQTERAADSVGTDGRLRTPDNVAMSLPIPAFVGFDFDAYQSGEGIENEAEADAEAEVDLTFNAAAAAAGAVGAQARSGLGNTGAQAFSATETNTKVYGNAANVVRHVGPRIETEEEEIPSTLEIEVAAEAEAEAEVGLDAAAAGAGAGYAGAPGEQGNVVTDAQTSQFAAAAASAAGANFSYVIQIPEGDEGWVIATASAWDPDCGDVAVAVAVAGFGLLEDGSANEAEVEAEGECEASVSARVFVGEQDEGVQLARGGTITSGAPDLGSAAGAEAESEVEVEVEAEAGDRVSGVAVAVAATGRYPAASTSSSTWSE